jgi:hypothetical protein
VTLALCAPVLADEPCNPGKNSLPAPTDLAAWPLADDPATTDVDEGAIVATWSAVPKATKYTVAVVASYELCTRSAKFEFTVLAPGTSISIPLDELAVCADAECTATLPAQAAAIQVKALNPPRGKSKEAQCNPFTEVWTVDVCDGVDGDCDGQVDDASCAVATIDLEKRIFGMDVSAPPGPTVMAGTTAWWNYVVTNTGGVTLSNVAVTDDKGVAVTCPKTTLAPAESMTCTGSAPAIGGPYSNTATAVGTTGSLAPVSDSDTSYYIGTWADLSLVKMTNGEDANVLPGVPLDSGSPVQWTYVVTNTGNITLLSISVTDDQGVVVTCPKSGLAPGESMTCTGSGTAIAGPYCNIGTATAKTPQDATITASDPSCYTGQKL